MRVIVTGSRGWTDRDRLEKELGELVDRLYPGEAFCIVHGACPDGADALAAEWAALRPWVIEERHPAEWERFGKSAGYRRNAEMVALDADVVLAFITPGCKGTVHTAALAQDAGLEVRAFFHS